MVHTKTLFDFFLNCRWQRRISNEEEENFRFSDRKSPGPIQQRQGHVREDGQRRRPLGGEHQDEFESECPCQVLKPLMANVKGNCVLKFVKLQLFPTQIMS